MGIVAHRARSRPSGSRVDLRHARLPSMRLLGSRRWRSWRSGNTAAKTRTSLNPHSKRGKNEKKNDKRTGWLGRVSGCNPQRRQRNPPRPAFPHGRVCTTTRPERHPRAGTRPAVRGAPCARQRRVSSSACLARHCHAARACRRHARHPICAKGRAATNFVCSLFRSRCAYLLSMPLREQPDASSPRHIPQGRRPPPPIAPALYKINQFKINSKALAGAIPFMPRAKNTIRPSRWQSPRGFA
jgi:hypothetical protein